jgi:hypothetical protein
MATAHRIEGLETACWGDGERENSVMGALSYALPRAGAVVSYPFLMGVSGAAFRFQLAQPQWCPSAPHAGCGYPCVERVWSALPCQRRAVGGPGEAEERLERAREALRASVDRGVPVLYEHEETSLIVGYEDDGECCVIRDYAEREPGYATKPLAELLSSWASLAVIEPGDAPDRTAAIEGSLRLAVELADATSFDRYAAGFAAFDAWITDLRDVEYYAAAELQQTLVRAIANAHGLASLIDARAAAVDYLHEVSGELDADRARAAAEAADAYAREVAVLRERPAREVAPAPWHLRGEPWAQATRDAEADLLERALQHEREAVGALRAAA